MLSEELIGALESAEEDCEDKSTEYMIQYMQDVCRCTFDQVMEYLRSKAK